MPIMFVIPIGDKSGKMKVGDKFRINNSRITDDCTLYFGSKI